MTNKILLQSFCLLLFIVGYIKFVNTQIGLLTKNDFGYEFLGQATNFTNDHKATQSTKCEDQLRILKDGIEKNEIWALKFIDAWAKIPSGIIYGHNVEMGNFDECLSLNENVPNNMQIKGKYCLTNVVLNGAPIHHTQDNISNVNLKLGICIPADCKASEVEFLLQNYFSDHLETTWKNSSVSINEKQCTQKEREKFNALDWVAIAILILLGVLMLLSTTYDYFSTKKRPQLNPLLTAFSVRSNMRALMHMTSTSDTPKHIIPALNGIRCLSIIWIIWLHSYMMLILSPNINGVDIDLWSQTPFYMLWHNGNYAVDTFFFLSGLLLISVAFRKMEKKSGKLNVPLMYLHRYIRLSPVLYLAVLLFMTLFRFMGNGPIWNDSVSSYHLCEENWWSTLLYVQNYASAGKMCLGHSWYLAVDMQLFILSPIALILIWKWRRWGLAALVFIGLLLVVCLFSIIIIDDLIVFRSHSQPGSDSSEMRLTYYSTHTRVSPWVIGIIFGYYLHTHNGRRVILSKLVVFLSWLISICLLATVIFVLYPKTQINASLITPLEGAFYLSLSRVAWPLGICWLVFACVNGYAGPINTFLSCKIWQPLSKLSYCMYIWHFLVVMINAGQIKTNSHFSNYDATLRFWSDFGITIILSTIMYLAIEAPMLGIEKFLLDKKPKIFTQPATISQENLCN